MRFSCTACGRLLPDRFENEPSDLHLCGVDCCRATGASAVATQKVLALHEAERNRVRPRAPEPPEVEPQPDEPVAVGDDRRAFVRKVFAKPARKTRR